MKVPATNPLPGSLLVVTDSAYVPALVPLTGTILIHLPGSAVVAETVQLSVPAPALLTCMVWEGGLALLGLKEKLVWPGRLSKNALLDATTVKLTGTVMDLPGLANSIMLISPV